MAQTDVSAESASNAGVAPLVVVTGGAGFIGSHTVDELIARGCRVVVLDNFATGKRDNLQQWADPEKYGLQSQHKDRPGLEIVNVDICHGIFAALSLITAHFGPVDRIVHLAAQVSVVHSVVNPLVDMQINYGGTLHVLEYARALGVKKVVFASSAAVYGDVTTFPVHEELPRAPLSPYGIDKYASELALAMYSQVHSVPTTALRFFNVYGPRQDPSSPYSGVISIFASRAKASLGLTIFGDGTQTRDFVYVGDVARAICAALFADDVTQFTVANVGTGREISVRTLAETVVRLCGQKSTITHAPQRAGEIARSVAMIDRLAATFGVRPSVSFEDGLQLTIV
jgi:UDP-glucose 4-epimerase